LAGGRDLIADKGRSLFLSGANAAISGDMLTTSGINISDDMGMIKELKFEVKML
jgi:biotin synthase